MKFRLISLVFSVVISFNVSGQRPAETVPDFNFFRLNKSSFTNKDLEPGKMLFFVFVDTECDHCQKAVLYIDQHYPEFKKTAIYLVTLDDQQKIDRFMSKYGQNLSGKKNVTLLVDLLNEFVPRFRPRKYPSIFLYSTERKLIHYEDNEQNMFRFLKQINAAAV